MSEERMVESIAAALRELGVPDRAGGNRLPVTHSTDVKQALGD